MNTHGHDEKDGEESLEESADNVGKHVSISFDGMSLVSDHGSFCGVG